MSFTEDDLRKVLLEGPDIDIDDPDYDEKHNDWYDEISDFMYGGGGLTGFGDFDAVASWNYGDGHEQGVVFRHKQSGRYFMVKGYYSSWDASSWESVDEVEPYEVTKIRYRKVKS